jgi:hypothetical protein
MGGGFRGPSRSAVGDITGNSSKETLFLPGLYHRFRDLLFHPSRRALSVRLGSYKMLNDNRHGGHLLHFEAPGHNTAQTRPHQRLCPPEISI